MVYVHFTVERFFFSYFNHLPAKRNVSANILGSKCPFWVANTIFLLLRKTYFSSRKKRSFRQNIDDIGYSPKLFFFLLFISYVYYSRFIDFFILYHSFFFTMQLLWAWTSRTETVGSPFLQYPPAYKKNTILYGKKSWDNLQTFRKLVKTNYCLVIVYCCTHFLHGNRRRQRLLFTRAYSLKSKPADNALVWQSATWDRERQKVQQHFFCISRDKIVAKWKKKLFKSTSFDTNW